MRGASCGSVRQAYVDNGFVRKPPNRSELLSERNAPGQPQNFHHASKRVVSSTQLQTVTANKRFRNGTIMACDKEFETEPNMMNPRPGTQSSQQHCGSSGSVSFGSSFRSPAFPLNPQNYYQELRSQPEFWQGNSSVGYPAQNINNNRNSAYGYFDSQTRGIGELDLPFREQPAADSCQIGYAQQSPFVISRTVTVRSRPPLKRDASDREKSCRSKKSDPAPTSASQTTSESMTRGSVNGKTKKIFISTSIKGLDVWSEVKRDHRIIFEVVGLLDSQVTESVSFRSKSFVLKDAQGHTVTCQFFETDRKLGRMCRGKLYRCVGSFCGQGRNFQTFSVREATSEDVRLYRRLVAVGNGVLKSLKEIGK